LRESLHTKISFLSEEAEVRLALPPSSSLLCKKCHLKKVLDQVTAISSAIEAGNNSPQNGDEI